MPLSDVCQGIKEHSNIINEMYKKMQTDLREFGLNIIQKNKEYKVTIKQLLYLPLNKKKMPFLLSTTLFRFSILK